MFKPSKENFTKQVDQSVFLPDQKSNRFKTNATMFNTQQSSAIGRHKGSMSFVPQLTTTSTSQFSFGGLFSPTGASTSRKLPTFYEDTGMEQQFKEALSKVNNRKLDRSRQNPKLKVMEAVGADDDDAPELFVANPSDDIPRNKLTEQLTRGLQAYV